LHEILALFWSWYVVYLQLPFSHFSEKKHSAAIYFRPLLQCKTNTSALEILKEMIRGPFNDENTRPICQETLIQLSETILRTLEKEQHHLCNLIVTDEPGGF